MAAEKQIGKPAMKHQWGAVPTSMHRSERHDYKNVSEVQSHSQEIDVVAALEVRRLRVGVENFNTQEGNMNRLLQITLSVLLLATIAGAQDPEQSWDNLRTLRVGEKIQVVEQKLRSQNGTFVAFSDDAITFQADKDAVTIQRADVFRVSSRERGRSRGRNALIGLAIGASVGLAVGTALDYALSDAPDPHINIGPVASFALLGTGIGAGVGAAWPPGHPTIYRAERRKDQTAP
ncbi:MAG: hypothetical protein A3H27_08365 [Acidobacteria bacterium RIFCSPLOWO2_02_FULL_59_13]|nr:MAG: hypothetical protein A3H27_08365 [Acidobacteria bacterium RIFCSPLOWO2_02_FULL_59_13]